LPQAISEGAYLRRCFGRFLAEAINRSSIKGCGDVLPFHAEERFFIQDQNQIDFLLALGGMPSRGREKTRNNPETATGRG
jgi:hypothetical protein